MLDKLEKIEGKFKALTEKLCLPEVLSNQEEFKKLSKERADLEDVAALAVKYRATLGDIQDAQSMLEEEADTDMKEFLREEKFQHEQKLEELTKEILMELLPKDPYADKGIIMEIRQGAGGEEAALFAYELMRLYLKYAERHRFKTEMLDVHETELGGIKEAIFSMKGKGVYARLKFESGVHRVQRVPDTEASGRIHTSTVTVAVLPEAEEVDVEINPNDLRVDTYRSSGAGGQHVNKTDSAVRITHTPTGIVVACQDERSQHQNREKAMRILRAKLLEAAIRAQEEAIASSRKTQVGSGERSEKIRTYNFPQSRVTDHRISLTVHNLENIMEGDIENIIQGLLDNEKEELLKAAGQ